LQSCAWTSRLFREKSGSDPQYRAELWMLLAVGKLGGCSSYTSLAGSRIGSGPLTVRVFPLLDVPGVRLFWPLSVVVLLTTEDANDKVKHRLRTFIARRTARPRRLLPRAVTSCEGPSTDATLPTPRMRVNKAIYHEPRQVMTTSASSTRVRRGGPHLTVSRNPNALIPPRWRPRFEIC